ncbi:MAG TPA: N-acyl homoserine lactonase family protein [Agriterribacter sp.]|nr:N-acyl homoserine lactonase family protein [Chitinophagaceae bacterium]HRP30412.1 N-acyl homoserine lactonase family protein [Agriterribacter sp.]
MKYFLSVACLLLCIAVSAQKNTSIYALKYAMLKNPPAIANWVNTGSETEHIPVSFHFWLIKTPTGKNVLVDAGCRMDLPNAIEFGLTDYERPDSVLLRLGVPADAVSDIIVSHPHWDHIDGLPLFPKATVWIQREDYAYYTGEAWQKTSPPGGIATRTIEYLLYLNMSGKLKLVDGDNQEIMEGITVFTGSKHTYNSQYVLVQSGKNKVVIASDNIWIYENLQKMLPPPSYGTMDPAGYIRNMQRMKMQASDSKFILPGHDDAMFKKFPNVAERIIKIL